ncbi:MAG: hotdog fold thioesterase [Chlamydiota bacterium]|jgi:uncharacterized protein (TIGR00369 family)
MNIWRKTITADDLNKRCKDSLSDHLGIVFTEVGENYLMATMPVNAKTRQPMDIMHGGASAALAETVGSAAGNYCVDESKICVGLSLNTNHLKMATKGIVTAKATPIHLGKKTQVWTIPIFNEKEIIISMTTLTLAVIEHP